MDAEVIGRADEEQGIGRHEIVVAAAARERELHAVDAHAAALASLNALKTQFEGLNTSIPDLSQTLADAIRDRQQAYDRETGLHFVFNGVKKAVKAQYGQNSAEFDQVSLIKW